MQEDRLFLRAEDFLAAELQAYNNDHPGQIVGTTDPQQIISSHLSSKRSNPKNLSELFHSALESLQNKQSSTNVISNSLPGRNLTALTALLYDFDPIAVSQNPQTHEWLLDKIIAEVEVSGKVRREPKSLWVQYCKSIYSAAAFFSKFGDLPTFRAWVSSFTVSPDHVAALPLVLAAEIHGFGVALACDFLKEIGYEEYGKPDTHTRNILSELGFSEGTSDYFLMRDISRIAKVCSTTAFQLDKILWLIGSGKFYLTLLENDEALKLNGLGPKFVLECQG